MSVERQLMDFIEKDLSPGKLPDLTLDTDLVGQSVLDSTAFMQLVLWLEVRLFGRRQRHDTGELRDRAQHDRVRAARDVRGRGGSMTRLPPEARMCRRL